MDMKKTSIGDIGYNIYLNVYVKFVNFGISVWVIDTINLEVLVKFYSYP